MFPIRDHNPSRRTPFVTYALIAINVVVFALYFTRSQQEILQFFQTWALIPANISNGQDYHTFLTAMFLHGGVMHIAGNMLFLFIFGDNLEDHFGPIGFLIMYLAAGIVASLAQIYANPFSEIPNVGASGAIAGVMGGYILLFPRAKVDVLIPAPVLRTVVMPAFVMLGLWFALQIVGGFGSIGKTGGGVAYWAHAGGFAAGVVLVAAAWALGKKPNRVAGHPNHPPTGAPSRIPIVRRGRRRPPRR